MPHFFKAGPDWYCFEQVFHVREAEKGPTSSAGDWPRCKVVFLNGDSKEFTGADAEVVLKLLKANLAKP